MKSLLCPGERVEFVVDELNLYLPMSAWVGVTPVSELLYVKDESMLFRKVFDYYCIDASSRSPSRHLLFVIS